MSLTRPGAIGLVLALLGGVLVVQSVAVATATSWDVDPLRYRDVEYHEGYRSAPVIHLIGEGGETYVLPERLWRGSWDGPDLAARLREGGAAAARVVGGEPRWLHGYPRVRRLEAGSVVLRAPPPSPARRWTLRLLGPLLVVMGVVVFRRWGRA